MTTRGDSQKVYFGKDLEAMSFARRYHEWIASEFSLFVGNRIAEVGAGIGDFTPLIYTDSVAQLVAFEPSQNLYPTLEINTSNMARVECVNRCFGDEIERFRNHFDTVLYVNVLEHIEDDQGELAVAWESLKPGGHLCIFVPALAWLFSELDTQVGHFRRYSKRELEEKLTKASFEILKSRYFDIAGIVPWYVAFVLLKRTITADKVSIYDRWIVPIMRPLESLITPPLGKNLLVVGRKPA